MNILTAFKDHSDIQLKADFEIWESEIRVFFEWMESDQKFSDSFQSKNYSGSQLQRKDNLWQTTCFEAFWSVPGSKQYFELNFSAQGEWNVYQFNDYRQPQPPKPSHQYTVSRIIVGKNNIECQLQAGVSFTHLDVGLTAIITTAKDKLYFALSHKSEKADFHIRNSFNLTKEIR